MKTRWLLILALGICTHAASAQRLNLGGEQTPHLQGRSVVEAVSAMLDQQTLDWEDQLERARRLRAGEDEELAIRLVLAWKRLARQLLADGQTPDASRAVQVMHGLTMAGEARRVRDLAEWYRVAAEHAAGGDGGPEWRRARAAILGFVDAVDALDTLPHDLPELDRTMRDTVGRLLPAALALPDAPSDTVEAWALSPDAPALDALSVAAADAPAEIRPLLTMLHAGATHPLFGREARELLATMDRSLQGLRRLDEWTTLDVDLRARLRTETLGAINALSADDTRPHARRRLAALSTTWEMLHALADVPLQDVRGMTRQRLHEGVAAAVTGVLDADDAGRTEALRAVESLRRILLICARRQALPRTADAAWKSRAVWQLLSRQYDEAEARLFDALPGIMASPARLHMPDVVSIIARHQDACDTLADLFALPGVVEELRAAGSEERAAAADRLESLREALMEDMGRADAASRLHDFLARHAALHALPGEEVLRRADLGATTILGVRQNELLRRIDRERDAWYAAWGADAGIEESRRRLDVLTRLGAIVETHARLASTAASPAREAAEVELSSNFVPLLNQTTPALLREALDLAFEGRDALALDALAHVERETAAIRLADELASRATRRGITSRRTLATLILELAQPPGSAGPEIPERERLARYSRWTFEWARASQAGPDSDRRAILAWLNTEAAAALDLIGPSS